MNRMEAMNLATEWRIYWTAALRSQRYDQTAEVLFRYAFDPIKKNDVGMCCLGVACDLVPSTEWLSTPMSKDPSFVRTCVLEKHLFPVDDDHRRPSFEETYMPDDYRALMLIGGSFQDTLTGMNDGGSSFSEIADFIDDNHEDQLEDAWDEFEDLFTTVTLADLPTPPSVPKWEATTTP